MSITYRQHQDTRDGKIYSCVLMPDGKWWSAENLAWDGAGLDYNNDPANGLIYGRLYSWAEANANCPPGSHLPSQSDFLALNVFPGDDLRSVDWGGSDASGFAALPAGYYFAQTDTFYSIGSRTIWWCQGGFAAQMYANSGVQPSTEAPGNGLSLRFIVDVFNEPIPPTKIKGAFSGSGVKAYFTNHNTATLELPISAQTTTELTIDKDFISFWGPFLGNVRILVVDGEYISEWKDWNFNV